MDQESFLFGGEDLKPSKDVVLGTAANGSPSVERFGAWRSLRFRDLNPGISFFGYGLCRRHREGGWLGV